MRLLNYIKKVETMSEYSKHTKTLPQNDDWIKNAKHDKNVILENNVVFLLDEAFEKNFNTSMYTDRFLAQLLAIIYVYGCEKIVLNKNIQSIVPIAMKRFNIYGGLRPNRRCRLVQAAIKSLEKRGLDDPMWKPIAQRLKLNKGIFK